MDLSLARVAPPLAALWGFAEATLFFVVPDVALSFIALRSRRIALAACLWAFAGALAGGAVMYGWGQRDAAAAERALVAVPAVDRAMVERVRGEIGRSGAGAIVLGPLRTTPYKIYMVAAGAAGVSPLAAAAASLPSRLGRFLIVTLLVSWAVRGPLGRWSLARQRLAVGVLWLAIYLVLMARGAPLL